MGSIKIINAMASWLLYRITHNYKIILLPHNADFLLYTDSPKIGRIKNKYNCFIVKSSEFKLAATIRGLWESRGVNKTATTK